MKNEQAKPPQQQIRTAESKNSADTEKHKLSFPVKGKQQFSGYVTDINFKCQNVNIRFYFNSSRSKKIRLQSNGFDFPWRFGNFNFFSSRLAGCVFAHTYEATSLCSTIANIFIWIFTEIAFGSCVFWCSSAVVYLFSDL